LNKNNTITVWNEDEVSPASFLHSHKTNIILQWNTICTTRTTGTGEFLEVIIHQDNSLLLIREQGRYVNHYLENSILKAPLRSFTCDTVPFSVGDSRDPSSQPRIQLHDILVDAFIVLK
jgi:hypothetical protein